MAYYSQSRRTDGQGSFRKTSSYSQKASSGNTFGRGQRGYSPRPRGNRFASSSINISRFVKKAGPVAGAVESTPEHAFADFKLDPQLSKAITAKGYHIPTPIQDKSIGHILQGIDIVGIANTGTGKTAAFLIPLINRMLADSKMRVLIMVPTRELAIQIEEEYRALSYGMRMYSVVCVGGMSMGFQIKNLKYGPRVIIGTAGRLKDLIERRFINLTTFQTVVLDEADRMLDMGFINDMRLILGKMPAQRHTIFFSATISREIEGLISQFSKEPVRISVKTQDTAENVDQDIVHVTEGRTKLETLTSLLSQPDFKKVLVFGQTKHGVEKLSQLLVEKGFKAESIHGNKNHSRRQSALRLFKQNHANILVATDVAARGLDISGISHVINYDIPATYDDYVHRIGRTGRGKEKGKALTLIERHQARSTSSHSAPRSFHGPSSSSTRSGGGRSYSSGAKRSYGRSSSWRSGSQGSRGRYR
ncbi:MAG: DEAD/DEAH box helicase [Patescibacteria group bacterium]